MAETSKFEQQINEILESIKDIANFEYYYLENYCFRVKVNELYKKYLIEKYQERDKEGFIKNYLGKMANSVESNDTRPLAPIIVHANYLEEARSALSSCLYSQKASTSNKEDLSFNFNKVDTPDPTTPIISPFDRRLDRLVEDGNSVYGIIPISTAYAQAGTIGYTVSESFIRDAELKIKMN